MKGEIEKAYVEGMDYCTAQYKPQVERLRARVAQLTRERDEARQDARGWRLRVDEAAAKLEAAEAQAERLQGDLKLAKQVVEQEFVARCEAEREARSILVEVVAQFTATCGAHALALSGPAQFGPELARRTLSIWRRIRTTERTLNDRLREAYRVLWAAHHNTERSLS